MNYIDIEFFKKIIKNKNNKFVLIILIIGIVLMLMSGNVKHEVQKKDDVYKEEKRLESIISDIKGAGRVSVMITYRAGSGKELAYETRTNRAEHEKNITENVDRQAVITSGQPVILREVRPEISGVIVTAEGAGNPSVKAAIREAVCAALDAPPHKVCIYEKG